MKRRLFAALVLVAACWGFGENIAQAQTWQLGTYGPPQVRQRSAVSPYINLLQGSPAMEYYGIVRPQMDATHNFSQLQQGMMNLQSNPGNPALLPQNATMAQTGSQTGHPATYMNYQRFFPLSYGTVSGFPGTAGMGYPGMTGTGYPGAGQTGAGYSQGQTFYPSVMNSMRR